MLIERREKSFSVKSISRIFFHRQQSLVHRLFQFKSMIHNFIQMTRRKREVGRCTPRVRLLYSTHFKYIVFLNSEADVLVESLLVGVPYFLNFGYSFYVLT